MYKWRIRIPLKILLLLDQKISKIEPETAELALSLGYRVFHFGRDKFSAPLPLFLFRETIIPLMIVF